MYRMILFVLKKKKTFRIFPAHEAVGSDYFGGVDQ